MIARVIFALLMLHVSLSGQDDFRPQVARALAMGEKSITIPPGTYRLAPEEGQKVVWSIHHKKDIEIIAEGVKLVPPKKVW